MKITRRFSPLALLAALCVLGLGATRAQAKPFDQAFIDSMTPHHQMASMMAEMAVQKASLPEVRRLARKIVRDQQKEIATMRALRQRLYGSSQIPPVPGMKHSMRGSSEMMPGMMHGMDMSMMPGQMMGMPLKMKMDMGKLMCAKGREFDRMFLRMMIPHHASAIVMADEALNTTAQPDIRRLAAQILDSQAEEIGLMHRIHDRRFGHIRR